jgi:hypothetical protein
MRMGVGGGGGGDEGDGFGVRTGEAGESRERTLVWTSARVVVTEARCRSVIPQNLPEIPS